MKKRKRAQGQARRDQSTPDVAPVPAVERTEAGEQAREQAGDEEGEGPAAPEDGSLAQGSAAADVPAAEATSAEAAPVSDGEASQDAEPAGEAQAASAGATEDSDADADADAVPDLTDDAVPAEDAEAPAVAAAGAPEDDDAGWEDAPTRELDIGNMEFAAAWSEASDTLPYVDVEVESGGANGEAAADGEGSMDGEPGEPGELGEESDALPSDLWRVESILESLLFATDRPLGVSDLKRLLAVKDSKIVTDALGALRDRRADSGIQLISVAGGWQLRTHPANGAWVAKLVAGRPQRLSRAMMEPLAIVAYRQPITRPEIDEIRGVDCGPVLRTLLDRNLIRIIGKKEEVGRPMLYGTTPEFLKTFSLRDLTELPTLREFHELGADEKAQVDKKLPRPEGADDASSAGDAPLRPATVELPQADPAEDEELFEELDRASEAAARASEAAAPPAETEEQGDAGVAGMGDR